MVCMTVGGWIYTCEEGQTFCAGEVGGNACGSHRMKWHNVTGMVLAELVL